MHDLNFAVVWSLLIFASCGSLRSCVFLACISACRQYNPSNWSIDGYKFHEKYFVFQKKKKKRNEDYWTFWGLFDLENITVSSYSMSYMRKNVQLTQIVVVKDIFGSLTVWEDFKGGNVMGVNFKLGHSCKISEVFGSNARGCPEVQINAQRRSGLCWDGSYSVEQTGPSHQDLANTFKTHLKTHFYSLALNQLSLHHFYLSYLLILFSAS